MTLVVAGGSAAATWLLLLLLLFLLLLLQLLLLDVHHPLDNRTVGGELVGICFGSSPVLHIVDNGKPKVLQVDSKLVISTSDGKARNQ